MQDDEAILIQQVKESNVEAFQVLFEKYHPVLFRTMYYRTGDERLAQDLAQEAFVRVWTNRERLKPNLAFYAYVTKLSKNLMLDHFKREEVRTRHAEHVRFLSEKPIRGPHEDLQKTTLERRIHQVVNENLPDKCRTIFILSRMEGLANQEIADTMGISKKTVENQLYRALKILKKKCSDFL